MRDSRTVATDNIAGKPSRKLQCARKPIAQIAVHKKGGKGEKIIIGPTEGYPSAEDVGDR